MKISRVFNLLLLIFPILAFISYTYSSVALTITFLTFTYHIWMRAICGAIFSIVKLNGDEVIFRVSEREIKLYEVLGVKSWKDKLPTYRPEQFKVKDLEQLYINMLHSELVHIAIVILSYVPLIISIFWSYLNDSILIFLITSVLSSLMDMSFVVAQRYNSPRVKRLMSLIVKEH